MENYVKIVTSILGAICGFIFGALDGLLYTLIALIVIDYISGVLVAIAEKKLSSEVGFKGIAKKVAILSLVAVGHLLDDAVLGGGAVVRNAVIFFYIANEGISILENAGNLGLPLPNKLKAVLKQLKESSDEEENEDEKRD